MKLIAAPLANLSHAGLRTLIHRFADPDEYFTEMIHCPSLLSGCHFEKWYLHTNPVPEKLVWQLTSPTTEAFEKAIPIIMKRGGIGIDLNMGCCAPPIIRSGAGFAWMTKPLHETAEMVKTIRKAIDKEKLNSQPQEHLIPKRLSVKLRLGTTADYRVLLNFCRMLESEGVNLITLHPRTQKQSYARPAEHHYTAQLAEDMTIPVYGNGDINSAEKLQQYSKKFPCSGWMIGRHTVQKPWIFKTLQDTTATKNTIEKQTATHHYESNNIIHTPSAPIDILETGLLFLDLLKTEQPPEFHITRAQRFFQFFCNNLSFAHYCRTNILRSKTLSDMEKAFSEYFTEVPTDRFQSP